MLNLQIFKTDEFNVRVIDGMFVGKDVARCLGYKKPEDAIFRHVDDEDKTSKNIPQPQNTGLVSKAVLINQSGVYSLVLSSKLPSAKRFKRWITNEVIPSIQQTGAYLDVDFAQKAISNPRFVIQLLEKIEEDKPKVELAEKFLLSSDAISIGDFAKVIGRGRNRLFKTLRLMGIFDNWNIPYQNYMERGYFKLIETTKHGIICKTPLITPKGQEYISKRLEE
jgi:anti-repressor protein